MFGDEGDFYRLPSPAAPEAQAASHDRPRPHDLASHSGVCGFTTGLDDSRLWEHQLGGKRLGASRLAMNADGAHS